MTEKTLSYDELKISTADIYQQMGYGTTLPDENVRKVVADMISDIRSWLKARFVFFVTYGSIEQDTNSIRIIRQERTTQFYCSKIITRQIRQSEAYAFFIATAGIEYQRFIESCSDDMLKTFIADAIGSVIAEACGDRMEEILQLQINKLKWKHTNRFSPGYCGWHVKEQQKLFALFNGITAGVALTDSSLMIPIKSISGIIGLGPNVKYMQYTCGICNKKDCYKRK